jgi:hypothetical protein
VKILRLLVLVVSILLLGYAASNSVTACAEEESTACPKFAPRDTGCKCCSDNHCKSGHYNKQNRCEERPKIPSDEAPLPEEGDN